MSKLHLSMLCLATAGLVLAGCGDSHKKVTGPAVDGGLEQSLNEVPSVVRSAKPAAAGLWSAAGPGATLVSDGSSVDPEMSYHVNGFSGAWGFSTTATQTGPVTVNYSYRGFHSYFQVRVALQAVVAGSPVATLVNDGPVNCCSSPSNGFAYAGSYTFNVTAGETYGFQFSGSHFDSAYILDGTFKLPGFAPPPPPADTTPPAISLNGGDLALECHVGSYTEMGATATDDVSGAVAVAITGSVDTNVEGDYTITYTATDAAGNTSTATRTVHVVDAAPPVITLNGAADLTLECHVDSYTELGATAVDVCDGLVAVVTSGSVNTGAEGSYVITYTAVDGAGHTATLTRTVQVVDTTAPAISLNGAVTQTIECHVGIYTELGATALDACEGAVTVAISGSVDTTVEGSYVITYTAVDGSGNSASATRSIQVVDTTAPALSLSISPSSLWPPNHKMVPVATISATDLCDPLATLSITVSSNEPVNGEGDDDDDDDSDHHAPDWVIVDNGNGTATVSVRAERNGHGTGRIYTISVTATDEAGNSTAQTGTVTVAHDSGKDDEDHGKVEPKESEKKDDKGKTETKTEKKDEEGSKTSSKPSSTPAPKAPAKKK